jgi:hypothetical protein
VGSRRVSRLSDSAVCTLYRSGASRTDICLRAGIYDGQLLAILKRNGVPRREMCEIKAIATKRRLGTLKLNPLRKRFAG